MIVVPRNAKKQKKKALCAVHACARTPTTHMTSLSSRLARRKENAPSATAEVVLPLAAMRDVVLAHPLVNAMRLFVSDVHAAVIALHVHRSRTRERHDDVPRHRDPDCPECRQGFVVFDEHEGHMVCDRCGLITQTRINIVPEYNAAPDVRPGTTPRGLATVQPWLLVDTTSTQWNQYHRDLDHWNHYTNLSDARVRELASELTAWSGTTARRDARVAAALLLDTIVHVPDAHQMRECIRGRTDLNEVVHVASPPEPTFPCAECAALCHDRRSARFHCRWLGRKRARP